MTWKEYYTKHNDGQKSVKDLLKEYNQYALYSEEPYLTEEGRKKSGYNIMILQENGYTLIQEGFHEYGLLQDFIFE